MWQIFLPLGLVLLFALLLAILAGIAEGEEVSVWADISLIFLLIPVMFTSFLMLAFISFGVFGVGKVSKIIPQYAYRAQKTISQMEQGIRKASDGTVRPFIHMHSLSAALRAFFTNFRVFQKQ